MKRDWEVVRSILLELEKDNRPRAFIKEVEGIDELAFFYHAKLLEQANLIEASIDEMMSGEVFATCFCLTWSGHEFLDTIRSKTVWERVKGTAKEKGVSMSIEVIKFIAKTTIEAALKQ